MRRKICKGTAISAFLAALLAACSDRPITAHATEPVSVFASQSDAANERSFNQDHQAPLAKLERGAAVTVLSDEYGKDYWACGVRTEGSVEGWVLCTSLDYPERSAGT